MSQNPLKFDKLEMKAKKAAETAAELESLKNQRAEIKLGGPQGRYGQAWDVCSRQLIPDSILSYSSATLVGPKTAPRSGQSLVQPYQQSLTVRKKRVKLMLY